MALLFADEDFPFPVVACLRDLGHDVRTTPEAGLAYRGIDDDIILAAAVAEGRAVLTMNRRDFIPMHWADQNHRGIVVCTRDDDVSALADRIHVAVSAHNSLAGQLIRINRPSNP